MSGVADLLVEAAHTHGDAVAVRDTRGCWTYRELLHHSRGVAGWLMAHGVQPHDRVLVQAENIRETVALVYGCMLARAACVPANPAARPFQFRHLAGDAEPVLAVGRSPGDSSVDWFDLAEVWRELVSDTVPADTVPADTGSTVPDVVAPDEVALLLYTSGSTGPPRAVVCPHAAVTFAARAVQERLSYRADDIVFCRIPLSFDYGLYQVFLCALAGAELVLAEPGREARTLTDIADCGATVVPLVPSLATMLLRLASRGGTGPAVRLFTNTGEHLPAETIASLRRCFPLARVQVMFGTTECKRISIMEPDGDLERPGSVGRPLPGTTVEICDEAGEPVPAGGTGEIVVRGPHVMSGYWRAPDGTRQTFRIRADGQAALHTGDYGRLDSAGYLYFEGRRDSIFKRNGTRTSAREIELAALDIPGVERAVVLPPDPSRDAVLVVVGTRTSQEVLRELGTRLEPAKTLDICHRFDTLPLTGNGKVDRDHLAALVADRARPPMAALMRTYGSPLYVYDLDRADAALTALRAALPSPSALYYSLKANPHPALVAAVRAGGCRAEVSSAGELMAAVGAGHRGEEMLYTGPGKSAAEIELALGNGVRRFSVESATDLGRVAEVARAHGATAQCLVRLNLAKADGVGSLRMTGTASQFGVDEEEVLAHPERFASRPGADMVGAHFFPMSNARDEDSLVDALTASVIAAARLRKQAEFDVTVVDLGGGFAAPYARPGALPRYPRLRSTLEAVLDAHLPEWRTGGVEIAFEAGRYLVGSCGRLGCTVMDVKRSRMRSYVVLDCGIHQIGGLAGLGRTLPASIVPDGAGDGQQASLVGPLCTPGDLLAPVAEIGDLRPGDVLEIPNVGGYGLTASLVAFLSRPAPVEVVLRGGAVVAADQLHLHRVPVDGAVDGGEAEDA
jgi:acyl-CoA synthetase (AMP-forming)/AMP-acid ligase II/diaminopimelate decarboxylase